MKTCDVEVGIATPAFHERFVLHPEAYSDLEEIWEYVADESPEAGDRLIEEIFAAIRSLVPFPHVGPRALRAN